MSESDRVYVAMMNLLWPRAGLDVGSFHDYWSGAHTQISSRLPGIHQYFQHHLDPAQGGLFPGSEAFRARSPDAPGFYGDAEITFATRGDLEAFAAALEPLMQDEQNVFDKTISYQATTANVATYADRSLDDSPNGDLGIAEKYMLYLRKRDDVAVDEFRERVKRDVAPAVASDANVLKVRARLVEPYDNEGVTLLAPNVSNYEDAGSQVQGCLEIAFPDALARRRYGWTETHAEMVQALLEVTRDIYAMRAVRTFTVYNHGRITTAGLRTPQMAAQIATLGATNQVSEGVRDLMMRPHPQVDIRG